MVLGANLLIPVILVTLTARQPIVLDPDLEVVDLRSGREGSLAVVRWGERGRALIADNQYLLGSSEARADEERQAHVGLLLHPAPEKVGVVGMGTGITAGAALLHDSVASISIMELSPLVATAADTYFGEFNNHVCRDPRVTVCREDARTVIASARDEFDVILGDLVTPWRSGASRLFSMEHFGSVHRALRPGGVFCQWLPMHQLTPEQFDLIAVTFQSAFPEVHVFRNHFKTGSLPLALVGFKRGGLDWGRIEDRCRRESKGGAVSDPLCRHPEGLALLYLGQWRSTRSAAAPINTLDNLRLEISASQQIVAGDSDRYFTGNGDVWFRFIQRQLEGLAGGRPLPEPLENLPETGLLASRWEVAHKSGHASETRIWTRLRAGLPRAVLDDAGADWSLWAGSRSPHQVNIQPRP